ncbi:hypothetical protein AABB24_028082 [Solanum stoloniferum]|uniref:Gag-pol polyprotein n=1 Tax=Solanum stoloniferum TaxID=62892 RepID=A0ABD2S6P7_9SOLN
MSSQQHRHALLKALNETHVPAWTNSDNLTAMVRKVIGGHRVSFSDEELPWEGVMHDKALHITIKCWDKIVNRVLIDDGSSLNICTLSTLKQLNFDLGKIRQNQVNVRAFDKGQRETLGAVSLGIEVGPADFIVEFQVMDINTSYNLLLERPWIHMAGVVPSTLHQLMKFMWNDHEVVIHGEEIHSNDYAPIVDDVAKGSDLYEVEIVNAIGDDLASHPPMPSIYKMIATLMLRSGFEPSFGFEKYLHGIIEPIQIFTKGSKFVLGYIPIADGEMEAWSNKVVDWELAKPVPHLYQSFPV